MKDTEVKIPCEDFTLEGKLYCPEGTGPFPVAVICHPHPLYGGDFRNNVVRAVYWELARLSFAALRFNFRGVGQSGGSYGDVIAETGDIQEAIAFVLNQPKIDANKLYLVGYSFGGGVSVPVAFADKRVKALVLISPMLDENGWDILGKLTVPKLLVTGSEDTYFPVFEYEANISKVAEPIEFKIVSGSDHFWQGSEAELAAVVGKFIIDSMKTA